MNMLMIPQQQRNYGTTEYIPSHDSNDYKQGLDGL
jgi:hypothetical protein